MKRSMQPLVLFGAVILAFLFVCGASPAGAAALDGVWIGNAPDFAGPIVLRERTDGRLIGYVPADPASRITGGLRTGTAVTIEFATTDPKFTQTTAFTGTLGGKRLKGTFNGGSGQIAITFQRTSDPFTVEHWMLGDQTVNSFVRAARVLTGNTFVTGGFVSRDNCYFLACGGGITAWDVSGTSHTIVTRSGGDCASSSTLAGIWDSSALLMNGSYLSTYCSRSLSGSFLGGKEGSTTPADIQGALAMLGTFADLIEMKSSAAADTFASFYMNDGKTKADWRAQLAALYAAYNSLDARIDGVRQIVSFNDSETSPQVSGPPRIEWHLIVSGIPVGGASRTTVLDMTAAMRTGEQLYWIGSEAGRTVFVGNGFSAPFAISMPVLPGDTARTTYGLWPFGVHGGGHPDGHPGWDIEYVPGAKARAAADGTVTDIQPNPRYQGVWFVSVQHRPGYFTRYDDLNGVEPGIAVGTALRAGDPLGTPRVIPVGSTSFSMIHFAVSSDSTVCPLDYLNTAGLSVFNAIWQTAAYGEELTEPMPCNPLAATFPLTRTWYLQNGSLAPRIAFTRLDPGAYAYNYQLLNASGGVTESGTVSLNPSAAPYSTIDLLPAGGGIKHLGIYDIVSSAMRIKWSDTARPTDMTGASEYTLAP